jgi:transposase
MNHVNFEKWVRDKLIPSLPTNSVVVMDNAPYHSIQVDKIPSKYSVKTEIIAWLRKKGISCAEKMRKQELFSLIAANKPREKTYRVDSMLASFDNTVLRPAPYMCDLSPIELAWANVKRLVRLNNLTGDLSLQSLMDLTKSAIASVTKEH